jgi:iron complex outermembrane receptor protein
MQKMKMRKVGMVSVSAMALMIGGIPRMSQAAAPGDVDVADTIIVTGTRDVGVKAQESATPIQVLGADTLEATGTTTVFDALRETLPSFSANGWSADASELVRAARLRGMNPGETLILVNGKRRHQSASITPGGSDQSPDTGSNPADLDMIPLSLIDHVEVLLDGAAAQYGSDAVAGVMNFILKKNASGTTGYAGGGISSRGDSAQGSAGASQAVSFGDGGVLDLSVDYRHHDFSNRNTFNCRTFLNGCNLPLVGGEVNIYGKTVGPVKNRIEGSPLSDLANLGINAELPLNADVTAYAFGTFGRRSAQAYENDREAARAPYYWPDGFFPRMTLNEVDGAITGGVKGSHLLGWDWDVSATYGRDSDHFGLINSYNTGLSNPPTYAAHPGLGLDTGFTGGSLSAFEYGQTTVNADLRRGFDIAGLAAPLNVAFGGEYRYETYTASAGDPGTYLDGGTQSEAGLTPTDASSHSRTVEAVYADLSTKILPKWTVDIAGRYENYSQTGVGDSTNGKVTTRYDFTPAFGIRGTVSNGFHAPSLAQSFYSQTGVTPTSLSITAPPSSPGAMLLGATPLKPETSKDVSFGLVAEPVDRMHVTVDVYQIFLDKAIIDSPQVGGPIALAAAAANGNPIPAALLASTSAYVSYFANSVNTRTRGLDVSGDYRTDFGKYGTVKWSLAANFNSIAITNQYPISAPFAAALKLGGQPLTFVTPQIQTDLTKSSPQNKITLAADWRLGNFDVVLRETRYGHADQNVGTSSSITPNANIYIKSAYITDIDLSYQITDHVKLDIGGNNVFDKLPGQLPYALRTARGSDLYPYYTPWGIDGAYFYSRVSASF